MTSFIKNWFTLKYWVHIAVISGIILLLFGLFLDGPSILTWKNFGITILVSGFADLLSHIIFSLD